VEEVIARDGTIMEVKGSERKVGKPSFAASAEQKMSKMSPRVFDPSTNRWVDDEGLFMKQHSLAPGKFRVMTFNVWFADEHFEDR
jgi:hypothetical protein